jgi:hypothetical protein
MKAAFKNVLLVSKTTRIERFLQRGLQFTPAVAKYNKDDWQEANTVHHRVVENVVKKLEDHGLTVVAKK